MQWSPDIDKIAPALLKAQVKMKSASKTSTNPHFKSKYADLSEVYDACKDALHENGITILQGARNELELIGVDTVLLHTSGQYIREILMLRPSKPDPQGAGSAITYARRYSLAAMIGVMQEDDDANLASSKGGVVTITGVIPTPHSAYQTVQPITNVSPSSYVISFGKFKGRKFEDVATPELVGFAAWLKGQETPAKPLSNLP